MKFEQSLYCLHRDLTRIWNADGRAKTNVLSYNEYEYLQNIEKLDGKKILDFSEEDSVGTHLSDLASEMQVSKASASVMVSKLEKKGLIRRFPCQFDARAQHIVLTDEGKHLSHQKQANYQEMSNKIKNLLDREDYQMLEEILAKVCQKL